MRGDENEGDADFGLNRWRIIAAQLWCTALQIQFWRWRGVCDFRRGGNQKKHRRF